MLSHIKVFFLLFGLFFPAFCNSALQDTLSRHVDSLFEPELTIVRKGNQNFIKVDFDIAQDYYIEKDKIEVETVPQASKVLGEYKLPPAISITNENGNSIEVFLNNFIFLIPIKAPEPKSFILKLKFKGCTAGDNICYKPMKKLFDINIEEEQVYDINALPEIHNFEAWLNSNNVILTIIGFFVVGLLLSFGPCILPMIPILTSIILGQKNTMTVDKSIKYSVVYVTSIAMTYAVAGMLSAIMESNLQQYLQTPLIIASFSAILLILAAIQFGAISYKISHSSIKHFIEENNEEESISQEETESYWAISILGILVTLIASPCTSVPLMGILSYISQTGNVQAGGIALFALGFGIGAPLIIIGALLGRFISTAGEWIELINKCLGVLLIALSIWIFQRIVPYNVAGAVWSVFILGTGIYLLLFNYQKQKIHARVQKAIAIVIVFYGLIIASSYNNPNVDPADPLHTMSIIFDKRYYNKKQLKYTDVNSFKELKNELRQATIEMRPAMVIFSAKWCLPCSKLERYVFVTPYIKQTLKHFKVIRADVTLNNASTNHLLKTFEIVSPPVIMFFDRHGVKVRELTILGDVQATELMDKLTKVKER